MLHVHLSTHDKEWYNAPPPITRGLIALDYQIDKTRITQAVKLIGALNMRGSRQGLRRDSYRPELSDFDINTCTAEVSRHP